MHADLLAEYLAADARALGVDDIRRWWDAGTRPAWATNPLAWVVTCAPT